MHLPQVIPSAQALEMLLLARNISADEALRMGLSTPSSTTCGPRRATWAATIASYSPAAVQATKRLATFARRSQRGRARRNRSRAGTRRDQG